MSTIKVKIIHTVEVDIEAWTLTYGDAPEEIRESVKNYCAGQLSESAAANEGCLTVLR